jgi:iron(III) transport system ATP-binding protein
MSSQLELVEVTINYGDFVAVKGINLELESGQIGCLLGPSGCGKTSLLRAIAGFEPVASGNITLHGQVISAPGKLLPPEQRRVGMVFQDFALFPHLDISRNIGFGLKGMSRAERRRRIAEMLELVGLQDSARTYPHELSGGQQQRIALARALAPSPDILLLDEPFSNLDSELREQLASEVRELLKRNGVTAVLVTHDQHEAFAMADHITLLREGKIAQSDSAYRLYHEPSNPFVASFIGLGSLIRVRVDASGELDNGLGHIRDIGTTEVPNGELQLLVRPEDIRYSPQGATRLSVAGRTFRGAHYLYQLRLPDDQRVACLAPADVDVAPGEPLPVNICLRNATGFN